MQGSTTRVAIGMHSSFDRQGSIHRATIHSGISVIQSLNEKLPCLATAQKPLYTFVGGGESYRLLAHGEATQQPIVYMCEQIAVVVFAYDIPRAKLMVSYL